MTRRSLTALSLLAVAGLLASCIDQAKTLTGPRSDGTALTAIVDESRGGPSEFFWLPPTVPAAPTVTGPFDATALDELVVEVCELDASNACVAGDPIERFTPTGNPVPQRITMDASGEYYTVAWLTGRSHVNVDKLYRVRVLRDGAELGYIDVQFVKNTPALGTVDPTQYVAVKRGQQLTIRFRIDEPSARTRVRLNEIESNGGIPGDWVELYNPSDVALSLSGYVVSDNDDTHRYTIPAGAVIPAGGFFVIDESDLGFGLGGSDAVRFLTPDGATVVDAYTWTSHAPYTYGRCPDGTADFQNTTVITKGFANDCTTPPVVVVINEIESNGGVPGDWVEIFNPGAFAADVSGFRFRDNDDTHTDYVIPAGTSIPAGGYLVLDEAQFSFGLGANDAARLFRQDGSLMDSHSWTAHAATTYARCPNAVGAFITATRSTKGTINDCSIPIVINEVESSGGTPGDWVELFNQSVIPVNVSGWIFKDNDDTHGYVIPAGTIIPGGSYLVLDEAQFGFGLGAADNARLFDASVALVDMHAWTTHAATTYARCPNGTGSFTTSTASTKGTANDCGTVQPPAFAPWPGDPDVQNVSAPGAFGGNLSGVTYEAGPVVPGTLWAVRNGPGTLFRLVWNGSIYTPDGGDWAAGKHLSYPNGTGDVDAEGVTLAIGGSAGGVYVSSERDNNVSSVSRLSILRYDISTPGTALTATHEWNLTSDLPVAGANQGLEAIAWVRDAYLVASGFIDERTALPYNPALYPDHQGGLFLVGLEANGLIYAYALDHTIGSFARVATIPSGFTIVKALEYDADLNQLWAICGAVCNGQSSLLRINTATGKFAVVQQYERPSGMANVSNEGFTFAPGPECVLGKRPAYWADDAETGGIAIRRGTLTCSSF